MCISWQGCSSSLFHISNGVKPGAVLSPNLFTVYLDELLKKLKNSGYGCHIGTTYVGALAYADDVVLMAPTKHALTFMLNICSDFSRNYDIKFNEDKSKFIWFPCRDLTVNNSHINLNIFFNDKVLQDSHRENHLGNIVGPNIMPDCINRAIGDFYMRVNQFRSSFSYLQGEISINSFLHSVPQSTAANCGTCPINV